uniref:Uncharacterized protein n=1 Tax=Anguilla anguilla TaxID=7936 RepID=A0A0E9XLS6_ANGAN
MFHQNLYNICTFVLRNFTLGSCQFSPSFFFFSNLEQLTYCWTCVYIGQLNVCQWYINAITNIDKSNNKMKNRNCNNVPKNAEVWFQGGKAVKRQLYSAVRRCLDSGTIFVVLPLCNSTLDLKWTNEYGVKVQTVSIKGIYIHSHRSM